MTDRYAPSGKFGVFTVIGRSLRLFFANFARLFFLGFFPLLAFQLLGEFLIDEEQIAADLAAGRMADVFGLEYFVLLFVSIFLYVVVSATLVMASYDAAVGDRSALGDYFSHAVKNFLPLAGLSLVLVFFLAVGFMALILPGLIVLAIFIVFYQTVLIDGSGWRGLHASAALTKGYRWPIIGVVCLVYLAFLAIGVVSILIFSGGGLIVVLAEASPIIVALLSVAWNACAYALFSAFTTVIYLRLRELHGVGAGQDLSEIFR
ncbi:MAG: hypothetical protein ACE5FS_03740 [Paracoccaceae bacterium]